MASIPSLARIALVDRLIDGAASWEFLWAEYEDARDEAARHCREAVAPADAQIRQVLADYRPDPAATAAERARDLDMRRAEAVPDYELIQHIHGELIDEACRIREALLQAPAPDPSALRWKIEQLLEGGAVCGEARRSLVADARRLLPSGSDRKG